MRNKSNKKLNIAIFGYGKVGKSIATALESSKNLQLKTIIDRSSPEAEYSAISAASLKGVDVVIDFSSRSTVLPLTKSIASLNPQVRIITGTSGWDKQVTQVKRLVTRNNLYFLYGANFSIGTALFSRIVNHTINLFNSFPEFDPSLLDIHHRHKKDMPSGTAKKIANQIVATSKVKKSILYGTSNQAIKNHQLHLSSLRVGENKGFHELTLDSQDEVIRISQQTRDRQAYALGSLKATQWLSNQHKPGFYTFEDYLNQITL